MKNYKVFHGLVNYGTQAGIFSSELRNLGKKSFSLVNPDRYKRKCDLELLHGGGFFIKLFKHSLNNVYKLYCFFKFDIFHFYYGKTFFPYNFDLYFYRFLGKKVVMEYLGNDIQLYGISTAKYKWTNMSFIMTKSEGNSYDLKISKRLKSENKFCDIQLVCAPIYLEFAPKAKLIPLAINLDEYELNQVDFDIKDKLIVLHAPTDRNFKGTNFILDVINELIDDGYNIELRLIENLNHSQLMSEYKQCHVFIDQILAGWYGTAAIEAMALSKPVVAFLRENYLDSVEYGLTIPIINANPDNFKEVFLREVILKKQDLKDIGINSRLFVEKVHCSKKVTQKLIELYNQIYL